MIARQLVERRPVLTPQPQHILVAGRGDQHHSSAAPLEQRVGRDGRAVDENVDRDWGLGIRDWGFPPNPQSPIANPRSPIANRQSPIANRQSPIPIPNPDRYPSSWAR